MRVLVIEDEIVMAEGLRRGLEAEGFATDVAHTGPDGLWMAQEHPYDAIVLDLMLPGMNGYRVCAALRAAEIWTPILMLTAKDGEFDEAEALDTGADDYLTKPFSYVALVARLRALLRRGRRPAPDRAGGRRPAVGPGGAPCLARRRRAHPHRARAGAARVPPASRRRGVLEDRDHRPRLGRRVRGRPEHRRGVRRPPARASSIGRSGATRSRRSAARATDWRPTVDDGLRRLRIRTTLAATAVVGIALVVAALALVAFVGRSLTNQVHEAAVARAQEVVELVAAGRPLPVTADPQEESIQVLAPGQPVQPSAIEGDSLMVTRQTVTPAGAERTVVVERGLDDMQDARSAVATGASDRRARRAARGGARHVVDRRGHARAGACGAGTAAAVRVGCRARTALARRLDTPARRGGRRAPRDDRRARARDDGDRGERPAPGDRRRSVAARASRRGRPSSRARRGRPGRRRAGRGEAASERRHARDRDERGRRGPGPRRRPLSRAAGRQPRGQRRAPRACAHRVRAHRAGRARHPRRGRRRAGHPRARASPGLRAFRAAWTRPGTVRAGAPASGSRSSGRSRAPTAATSPSRRARSAGFAPR